MKKIFFLLLAIMLSFLSLSYAKGSTKGMADGSLDIDGIERVFHYFVPEMGNGAGRPLLLIFLHGGGGSGKNCRGFNDLAKEKSFIVVCPDGLEKHWTDGRGDKYSYAARNNIDDVKFISRLIDYFSDKYNADKSRVFVCGISNGGMMAFRLACELSEKITAVATVAASMPENLYKNCRTKRHIPILIMHGTDDQIVPWGGGDVSAFGEKRGRVVAVEKSLEFWVKRNECDMEKKKKYLPDHNPDDGTRVWVKEYINSRDATRVLFYGIEGGGHNWPGGSSRFPGITGRCSRDINAEMVIWRFFDGVDD